MKKVLYSTLLILFAMTSFSCSDSSNASNDVLLPNPKDANKASLIETLKNRRSVRLFTDKAIGNQELANLLWAANGINRDNGKRTAPSAVNAQDIELYVFKDGGNYHYDPTENKLVYINDKDIRPIIQAHNSFMATIPVFVLLVTNQNKFENYPADRAMLFGAMDAGYVSENINIYCAANKLATVPCAPKMDIAAVQEALNLPENYIPIIYHPIGYEKE